MIVPSSKRSGGQLHFDARVSPVNVFVEMRFDNPIVVQPETFAERILRNFQPPIHIASQGRREIEADGQGERTGLELRQEDGPVRRCCESYPDELSDLCLIGSAGR
jgi:hypothetical protein